MRKWLRPKPVAEQRGRRDRGDKGGGRNVRIREGGREGDKKRGRGDDRKEARREERRK